MGKIIDFRKLAIFTVAILSLQEGKAQDPTFSQFYANSLYLNPAFAGTARCPRVSLNYRNQWASIPGNFVTYSAAYDQHFDALSGGVGLLVTSDQAGQGVLTTNTASLLYSYQLPVTRHFSIKAGVQASYFEKRVNWDDLTFGDMIDPRKGFVYETAEVRRDEPKRNVDFSAGILGFSEKYYGGVAVHHLTEPDESPIQGESKLPRKLTVHAGAALPILGLGGVEKGIISPNIVYMNQNKFNMINYGFYATRGVVVGGLWFRQSFSNADAFIALIGFQQETFKVGYSYDITVSKLANSTGGSHEISFTYNFACRTKKVSYRTVNCPSF